MKQTFKTSTFRKKYDSARVQRVQQVFALSFCTLFRKKWVVNVWKMIFDAFSYFYHERNFSQQCVCQNNMLGAVTVLLAILQFFLLLLLNISTTLQQLLSYLSYSRYSIKERNNQIRLITGIVHPLSRNIFWFVYLLFIVCLSGLAVCSFVSFLFFLLSGFGLSRLSIIGELKKPSCRKMWILAYPQQENEQQKVLISVISLTKQIFSWYFSWKSASQVGACATLFEY